MSDTPETNATPAPEPVNPAPAAPVESGQPAQQQATPSATEPVAQQYDPSQVQDWQRQAQQYQGARPLIDATIQAGFKTPEDINSIAQLRQAAESKGLDLAQLASVLQGKQDQPQSTDPQPLTEDGIKQLLSSTLDERDASSQFKSGVTAMDSAINAARTEVAQATGMDANDPTLTILIDSLQNKALQGNFYPQGHPLHETKLKPLDTTQVASIKQQAIDSITALRGGQAVANANNALSSIPTQPNGSGLQSVPGEGVVQQTYNPHGGITQDAIANADAIIARALGATSPGVVANAV